MGNQQVSLPLEMFKPHPVYTRLEIGEYGTVRNIKDKSIRYSQINRQGYLTILYRDNNKFYSRRIHRLVAETWLPPPSPELLEKCLKEHHGKPLVRHLDNNKLNNACSNLEWCDVHTNNRQAIDDNLVPHMIGERNGRAVLTEDLVHAICKDFEGGMTPKESVQKYGISRQQSTKIRAGYQWRHIWEQYNISVNRRKKTSTVSRET
jgi:hypothetical protein